MKKYYIMLKSQNNNFEKIGEFTASSKEEAKKIYIEKIKAFLGVKNQIPSLRYANYKPV